MITLETAVEDFLNAKSISLSIHTLQDYGLTFRRALAFFPAGQQISEISPREIRSFLATVPGSKKNRLNAHIALSSLWSFCQAEGYTDLHVLQKVEKPKPVRRVIPRFTEQEIRQMLHAAQWTTASQERGSAIRDRAILLTLLDTGIRASELCNLTITDMTGNCLRVTGKGSKERDVYISARTLETIDQYLLTGPEGSRYVFLSEDGKQLTRSGLFQLVQRIGEAAGVSHAHPHRFRHTFAVNFLINGGDAYTLKRLLGHSTLAMVEKYLDLSREDLSKAHGKASPVSVWDL